MRLKSCEGREGQYWSGEADLCNLIYPVSAPPAYLILSYPFLELVKTDQAEDEKDAEESY